MPTVIVMPGTGSDADFAARVFGTAAHAAGARLVALEPESDLVGGYRRQLDEFAADSDEVIVGGISIGAVIALDWVLQSPLADRCTGVLAALPPWTGAPGDCMAALSARLTADSVERDGLEPTIASMIATSPAWLADELSRSWRALASRGLVGQLRAAAGHTAPDLDQLAALPVPVGIAVAPDDPLHPAAVGRAWAHAAPHAAVREVPLTEFGLAEHLLGEACLTAWRAASSAATPAEP